MDTLFTSQGSPVIIEAYCGKHHPKWAHKDAMLMLVKVRFIEEQNATAYRWSTELRANGGINEIERLIDAAPELKLNRADLKSALEDAG